MGSVFTKNSNQQVLGNYVAFSVCSGIIEATYIIEYIYILSAQTWFLKLQLHRPQHSHCE